MKRKDLRNEADFLPANLEELFEVRARVMELGESRRTADGLCMWLAAKARGEKDTTDSHSRSNYRRILRELEQPEPIGTTTGAAGKKRKPRVTKTAAGRKGRAVASSEPVRITAGRLKGDSGQVDITGMPGNAGGDELEARRSRGAGTAGYTRGEQLELVDVGSTYTRKAA